jgi:superfamily II DNA or RNA helicase
VEGLGRLLEQLPEDVRTRGRRFEQLCQWFLRSDPVYAGRLGKVWLWDDWPGRWGADAGIDLVAETFSGELWAIQAKAYDPRYAVTKGDVDTFLSESARPTFSYRLLIATTDRIGARAAKTMDEQVIPAGFLGVAQLERAPVVWPSDLSELRHRPFPRKQPLPHSREAITAVREGFKHDDRGQLVMACGTGKTLIGLWVFEQLGCERALVLVPSLSLLAQTLREWTSNAVSPFNWLAVCSDPSVEQDDLVEHTSELGFPTTTGPATIAAVLSTAGRCVVFATYQSSPRISEAFGIGAPAFDLAIADEAHRCAGPTASSFATIIDAESIHAKRRLFMTATPRHFTARVKRAAEGADLEVASMDDEERFGPVFHRLSFGEAIERGLLSDYQVVVVGVDDAMCAAQVERAALVRGEGLGVTDARSLAGEIGLAKAIREYDLRRLVSFHNRVSAARVFAERLPDTVAWMPEEDRPTGTLWAEHVSGAMPAGRRETLLRRLRDVEPGARGLLANARCLGEGVDIPAIDGIAFIDPRRSMIDVTQAVGRAIRRSEDKVSGTVVLPVFVETGADPEEVLTSGAFRAVWDVVRALRAHDDTLAEALDDIRRQLGRLDAAPFDLPHRIHVDLPDSVREEFVRAFWVQVVECATATWEQWFGMLEVFVEREGHALVPVDYSVGPWCLGHWVAAQRRLGRAGVLSTYRHERLDSVPGWSWTPAADEWDEGFDALQSFVQREGHASVPKRHVEAGVNLGTWVQHRRNEYHLGGIDPSRVALLDAVPGWVWNTKEVGWQQGFELLQRFVARTGHALVPSEHIEDGFSLGHWVLRQRHLHERQQLGHTRDAKLQTVPGWVWYVDEQRWESAYSVLEAYVAREGHSAVPNRAEVDGVRLGTWVAYQRTAQTKGRLRQGRADRLAQLPGWTWDPLAAAWEENFLALVSYVSRNGSAAVPQHCVVDGYRLGWWIGTQRQSYRRGTLDAEKAERLQSLQGWSWHATDDTWEEAFRRLKHFVTREGHAMVPVEYIEVDGYRLGQWTAVQRRRHAIGKLANERARRLETLPGWVWDMVAAKQQVAIAHLRRFVAREGHARVPVQHVEDGFPLGGWASERRKAYRRGKLDETTSRELEGFPGWRW